MYQVSTNRALNICSSKWGRRAERGVGELDAAGPRLFTPLTDSGGDPAGAGRDQIPDLDQPRLL
jgi:hypothetical protein